MAFRPTEETGGLLVYVHTCVHAKRDGEEDGMRETDVMIENSFLAHATSSLT